MRWWLNALRLLTLLTIAEFIANNPASLTVHRQQSLVTTGYIPGAPVQIPSCLHPWRACINKAKKQSWTFIAYFLLSTYGWIAMLKLAVLAVFVCYASAAWYEESAARFTGNQGNWVVSGRAVETSGRGGKWKGRDVPFSSFPVITGIPISRTTPSRVWIVPNRWKTFAQTRNFKTIVSEKSKQ